LDRDLDLSRRSTDRICGRWWPPGESLRGIVAATQSKTFSGSLFGVGITERRLILQSFDRKIQPNGAASVLSSRERWPPPIDSVANSALAAARSSLSTVRETSAAIVG
jgi:hypothetical protein